MRLQTLLIVASACLCGVGLFATLGGASATPPAAPIPLQEIQTRGIEGRLGFRLGTVISVAGHIVPNASRAKADVDEPFFAQALTGMPLDCACWFFITARCRVGKRSRREAERVAEGFFMTQPYATAN